MKIEELPRAAAAQEDPEVTAPETAALAKRKTRQLELKFFL
jgi:hypothetical protein